MVKRGLLLECYGVGEEHCQPCVREWRGPVVDRVFRGLVFPTLHTLTLVGYVAQWWSVAGVFDLVIYTARGASATPLLTGRVPSFLTAMPRR
jgi:hypothetical protein